MAHDNQAGSPGEGTATISTKAGKRLGGSCVIELGNDQGVRVVLHTLRKTVRGRFSLAAMARRKDANGKRIGMRSVGDAAAQLPETPGITYKFEFGTNQVTEHDPLTDNPELHAEADRAFGRAIGSSSHKTKPWPTVVYKKMQDSVFKTLAREMRRLVECDLARVIAGELPPQESLDALPGRYMHDPYNSSATMPKYEDQLPEFYRNLESNAA